MFLRGASALPIVWHRSPVAQNVLVCLGQRNQEASKAAFDQAVKLGASWRGRTDNVQIKAAFVPHTSTPWTEDPQVSNFVGEYSQVAEAVNASGSCVENQTLRGLPCGQMSVEVAVEESGVTGKAGVKAKILDLLQGEKNIDLVVLGAGGKTSYTRLGSVVEHIVRRAPCDVLIARSPKVEKTLSERKQEMEEIFRLAEGSSVKFAVGFGVNNWEGSVEAFRAALALARPGDVIDVVHVPELISGNAVHSISVVSDSNEASPYEVIERELWDVVHREGRKDVKTTIKIADPSADPVGSLAKICEDASVDILSVGYGGHTHALQQNSFSYNIAHSASCSVLVSRPAASQRGEESAKVEGEGEEVEQRAMAG